MASNSDVAHAWAHGLGKHQYGSNMHHDGYGLLYSYSTCIGQRFALGENIIFITNSCHYSSSTSKHQCYMNGAIPKKDKNVFVFNIDRYQRGASYLLWLGYYGTSDKDKIRSLLRFGFDWLVEDYADCVGIKECNKLDNGFNRSGFQQFIKWLEVTGCSTISKLLKLSSSKLFEFVRASFSYDLKVDARKFRTFFRLLVEKADDEKIVDAINGKGTWNDYLDRTKGLRLSQKMRRITKMCCYVTSGWNNQFTSVYGCFNAKKEGSITSKTYQKLQKTGNLIKKLYAIKKENIEYAVKVDEANKKRDRKDLARKRLERHCGLRGWTNHYMNWQRRIQTFDYCGTVIRFSDCFGYDEREISTEEYNAFTALSIEEQKAWIENKKRWMLEQLQQDRTDYENRHARYEEERRIEMERKAKQDAWEAERAGYKAQLLSQGESGLRQAWHEGFRVSVWNQSLSFYFGGNVLLRVVNGEYVETSKGIKISKDECQRLWMIINRWHNNKTEFVGTEPVRAIGSTWKISRYQNDIMTAGCHSIAYCEMEYVAKQLGLVA